MIYYALVLMTLIGGEIHERELAQASSKEVCAYARNTVQPFIGPDQATYCVARTTL